MRSILCHFLTTHVMHRQSLPLTLLNIRTGACVPRAVLVQVSSKRLEAGHLCPQALA